MKRFVVLAVAALAALLALAGPAFAHVTVSSTDAKPGGYAVLTFRVPTESATASTTKLVVQLPTDTPFASVNVQPVPGWVITTKTTKLAEPVPTEGGDQLTSAVSEITWTAQPDAAIKPGQFQQFPVSVGRLPQHGPVTFPAVQTYSDGTVVKWIETPAPGSSAEPDHPAPTLQLSAAATPAAETSSSNGGGDTAPTVLSIVALVLSAGALGVAVVSRARRQQ